MTQDLLLRLPPEHQYWSGGGALKPGLFRIRLRLFREVSASTPDPDLDPVSKPTTLVSASRELRGKLALYS
jgi:hypothetical protein